MVKNLEKTQWIKIIVGIVAVVLVILGCCWSCNSITIEKYKDWMNSELNLKEKGVVYNNIKSQFNGASITDVKLQDCKKSSQSGNDYVTFRLAVNWVGKFGITGSADIDYVCKNVSGQFQYHDLKIVSSKNPTANEYCKALKNHYDNNILNDSRCEERIRIENNQHCRVTSAQVKSCNVKTLNHSNDTGINGSNIDKIGINIEMLLIDNYDRENYYSVLSYYYNVEKGQFKYNDSGVTDTNQPKNRKSKDNQDDIEIPAWAVAALLLFLL